MASFRAKNEQKLGLGEGEAQSLGEPGLVLEADNKAA